MSYVLCLQIAVFVFPDPPYYLTDNLNDYLIKTVFSDKFSFSTVQPVASQKCVILIKNV